MTQPLTSERISVSVAPDAVQLAPGSRITIMLTVTNAGAIVDQFGLVVEGLESAWYTVREGLISLYPGATGRLELDIHLPEGAAAVAGTHQAVLRVVSREAPNEAVSVTLPLGILAVGRLEASLNPQRVRIGRRGTARYAIALTNPGNEDLLVDLTLRDPELALLAQVTPDRVSVPHGSSAEAVVTGRPRARPLASLERSYAFSVELARAPVEGLAEVDALAPEVLGMVMGELVYHPPLATFAALPLSTRRLLMAVAALAVVAALLIWFLAAPGRRGALIEQVPATKPVVAAAETALNLPQKVATGDAAAGTDTGAGQAPQITSFVLATPGQDGRTDYALVWAVEGADQVKIDGTPQPQADAGSLHLDKLENTEHVLEASKNGVSVNQSVGIVILRPPDVQSFVADPVTVTRGQSTTLRWQATRADRAAVGDQAVDPAAGSLQVTPTTSTTYTLTVENELGRSERSLQVQVLEPTTN